MRMINDGSLALITDIKHFAVHDGDGIRTTVFFKGCPMHCVWCHNPEAISSSPEVALYAHKCVGCGECKKENFTAEDCLGGARILYGREIGIDELMEELLLDRDFYESSGGGVTLSGGECLMQTKFSVELLKRLKKCGINTAVDTCGCVPFSDIEAVLPYTDVFLYDLKAIDPNIHKRFTGVSNGRILENLRRLDSFGVKIEIRIPYVPECNGEEIEKMAEFIADLEHVSAIKLLPYHDLARSKYLALGIPDTMPSRIPDSEEIFKAMEILSKKTGLKVTN